MPPPFQPRPDDRPYLRRLAWTIAVLLVMAVIWRASNLLLLAVGCSSGPDETAGQKREVVKKKGVKPGSKKDIEFLSTQ